MPVVDTKPAEAALPFLKGFDGLQQLHATEIRPESVGHIDLGISGLPEQKIAQAHLAARPNEKIEFGQTACVEMPGDCFLIDAEMLDSAVARGFPQHGGEGVHQFSS